MSRLLLLIIVALWLVWNTGSYQGSRVEPIAGSLIFLGVLLAICAGLLTWGRFIVRATGTANVERRLDRFGIAITAARMSLPIWFAFGLFILGWGQAVQRVLGPIDRWPVELPGLLLGTAPVLIAWLALQAAQYPAENAAREYALLDQLESDLPLAAPPTLRGYLDAHVRMQLLFTLAPILLIWFVRDIGALLAWAGFGLNIDGARSALARGAENWIEWFLVPISIIAVLVFGPELLRRVLKTTPLPPSPLRERLDAMCARLNLRCRDILIWQTDNNICNAIVMGLFPRVRYVLLSDLILQRMTDEQIEAVFAHEAGHIKHRHIAWYALMIVLMIAILTGPGESFARALTPYMSAAMIDLVVSAAGIGIFVFAFAALSRRFERQADVFAARTIQDSFAPHDFMVGHEGVAVFNSALNTVARINGMPTDLHSSFAGGLMSRLGHLLLWLRFAAANWTHGSIGQRMRFLEELAHNPDNTPAFDRQMRTVYIALIMAVVSCTTWAIVVGFL